MSLSFHGKGYKVLHSYLTYPHRLMRPQSYDERASCVRSKVWSSDLYAYRMFECIRTCLQIVSILGQLLIVEKPFFCSLKFFQ